MGTEILDYCKGLVREGQMPLDWAMTPDYTEIFCDAIGGSTEFQNGTITFENMLHYIERAIIIGTVDDVRLITKICAHPKFTTEMLTVEFLAAIMVADAFDQILKNENAKAKILVRYNEIMTALPEEESEAVVIQCDAYTALAENWPNDAKRAEYLQEIQNKINDIKEQAENIRDVRSLLKFHAVRYNDNRLKKNLRFVEENYISVWGKNLGGLFVDSSRAIYDAGRNDEEKQQILDGIVISFDTKMLVLRHAWGIKDDEALHNFMVEE